MLQSYEMKIRNLLWGDCGRGEIRCFLCSECDGAVAHAARGSEGSQGCREDADDDLQDGLPSLFLHGVNGLRV